VWRLPHLANADDAFKKLGPVCQARLCDPVGACTHIKVCVCSGSSSRSVLSYLVTIVKNIVKFVNQPFVLHVPNKFLMIHQIQTIMVSLKQQHKHKIYDHEQNYKHNVECVMWKNHMVDVIPVVSIHHPNGNYVVVVIATRQCVIRVFIFVHKNHVKSYIVTVVVNSRVSVPIVVSRIMIQWMNMTYTVISHNKKGV